MGTPDLESLIGALGPRWSPARPGTDGSRSAYTTHAGCQYTVRLVAAPASMSRDAQIWLELYRDGLRFDEQLITDRTAPLTRARAVLAGHNLPGGSDHGLL